MDFYIGRVAWPPTTSLKLTLLGGMLLAILGATLLGTRGTSTDTECDISAALGEQLLENTTWTVIGLVMILETSGRVTTLSCRLLP